LVDFLRPFIGVGRLLVGQERLVLVAAAPHTGEEDGTLYSLHLPTPLTVFRYQLVSG
jgi:hypothetical protein